MKNKVFKISVILVMILTMTMTNFIFVGNSFISYALDNNNNTNNSNVEFNTYFKNEKGEHVSSLDMVANNHDTMLYMYLNVKQEGYFSGSISLGNETNFKLVESNHPYVENVEHNTVKLYNITAGTSIEIPVKIEPIKEETYSLGLLDMESKMTLNGIYKDSSEKDKKINATKSVKLKFIEEAVEEDIVNEATVITNKVATINGEEKRVVQLSWKMGTKSNSYPIKEITAKIQAPKVGQDEPQVETQVNLNTMTNHNHQYENGVNQFTLTNPETKEGMITWKTSGTENIILTYLYDKNVQFNDIMIQPEVKVVLHNQKEINSSSQLILNNEEKDSVVEIATQNQENEIYKGKLVAGIERPYTTKTNIKVNLAKMVNEIVVQENESTYTVEEAENSANIFYSQTFIAKEQFDKLLGENGSITIFNQANQVIGTINATNPVNENGYLSLNYGDSQTKGIKIQTSKPIAEGLLEINHIKSIKETQSQMVKGASRIHSVISCQYNQGLASQIENNINLQNTVTEAKVSVDAEQLSTVVKNHIDMKITLLSNEEKYDLYEDPSFTITLPKQVEGIHITNISKLYDDNNEFGDTIQYALDGNNINLVLKGKQRNYTATVEGITLVVEAEIQVNKTAATSDEQIVVAYQNTNAVTYANNGIASTPIKITAPKEITAVNSIRELAVETIGEEEKTEIMMEKGTSAKQVEANMEIINSNVATIQDVKVLGDFPTNDSENNMGIAISRGIQVAGADNAKVYYSENEKATDNIEDAQNGWSENLDGREAKKYLISLDTVNAQSSVQATYQMAIPENLEYNKLATEGYSINAINSETGTAIQTAATTIAMQTGVGPKVESQIQAVVGTDTLKDNDVVKTGEVIQYQVKVANTGTEEAKNIKVMGGVPEGTTLVEPMEYYEYTGAAYYQEKADEKLYTKTIDSLKSGESTIVKYEVRVNKDVKAGTSIKNETEVQYGEAKTTSTMTNMVQTSDIRVSLKRITDRSFPIYIGDALGYYAIIENTTDTEQKNVTIQTNLSDNAEVEDFVLMKDVGINDVTGDTIRDPDGQYDDIPNDNTDDDKEEDDQVVDEEGEITFEGQTPLEYKNEVNIGNLNPNETKVLYYAIKTKTSEKDTLQLSVTGKLNNQTCRSNLWEDTILYYHIKANMVTGTETQFVAVGDEIEYKITVENTGTGGSKLIKVLDNIPNDLNIKSITIDGKEQETTEDSNEVKISTYIDAQSTTEIVIKATVAYHENTEAKTIKNVATIERNGEIVATTPEITHIIKANTDRTSEDDNTNGGQEPSGEDNNNNSNQNTTTQENNMIAGVAWVDANANGIKDVGETLLSNITVKLLNVETNEMVKNAEGNEMTATTNAEGMYLLQNVTNGKYIAIFEYDTTKYGLTTYQVSGASESVNSNAVMNELNINGTTTKVASTDIITINHTDIANINIGLIELKNFDLQLEKRISRILIQNASGSTVRQYDNVDMAKIELDAKKIKGSTVLIEYNIKVSNVGEVDGYVKKVIDYMPSDLKFSSELNKDWYQTNGALYNASLANEKITAGTSKNITLTLTKSMTENNTGLTTNEAEIAEDYNELGIKDSNSTPGNKAQGENDMSRADVIISIRTGGILVISIVIAMLVVGCVVAFIILKNRKNEKEEIR